MIARNRALRVLPYKEGILSFPSQHKVCIWNETDGLQDLIGCGKEGNLDGKASHCELYHPIDVCVEFDNVVCVADYRSSCIKIASTMIYTATFLSAIGKLCGHSPYMIKKVRCFSHSGHDERQVVFKSNYFFLRFKLWKFYKIVFSNFQ